MEDAIGRSLCRVDQQPIPVFYTDKDAEAWYKRRVAKEDNNKRTQLFYTLVSWQEVTRVLLRHLETLGQPIKRDVLVDMDDPLQQHVQHVLASKVYSSLNPDATLNMLRYCFFHMRCGIFVSIRSNRVAAFLPFVNVEYENKWHHKVWFENAITVKQYNAEKAKTLRRKEEDMLPVERWWMNGGIMCNVMPETYWGDAYLAAIRSMLDATCAAHETPDVDFFINKRDYPQLKRDGSEPYSRWTGVHDLCREVYSAYAPIFSFYSGTDMADVPMPCTEDWVVASRQSFPGSPYSIPDFGKLPEFRDRQPKAVFRGSSTGHGITDDTNSRLKLVRIAAARPDLIDAGITTYNSSRDKCLGFTSDGHIVVDYRRAQPSDVRASFMSMRDQAARFRYLVYVDGHAAASRYGTIMHSGCVILRTLSDQTKDAGHLWMFPSLVGAAVGEIIPDDADHMCILPDFSNLFETIEFLNANVDIASRIADWAKRRAPTVERITAYWHGALSQIHTLYGPVSEGKSWYSPADPQYARLNVSDSGVMSA